MNTKILPPLEGDGPTWARPRSFVGRRWKFLAEASVMLDESLDYETTLANVMRLAVPAIADYAGIGLLTDDGAPRWAYTTHRVARKAPLAERLRAYEPSLALHADPFGLTMRSGRALLIGAVEDEHLRSLSLDETHLALLRELAPTSYIGVPLWARGRTLGATSVLGQGSNFRFTLPLAAPLSERNASHNGDDA